MKAGARGTQITISHLDNANRLDGEVPLSEGPNLMGQHTLFSSSADGAGGKAMWNQGAKTLTLFVVKDVECTVEIQFSFTLEVHVCVSLCLIYMCIFYVFCVVCVHVSHVSVCRIYLCVLCVLCVCVSVCLCVCVSMSMCVLSVCMYKYVCLLFLLCVCVSLCLIYLCIFYFFCVCVSMCLMCLVCVSRVSVCLLCLVCPCIRMSVCYSGRFQICCLPCLNPC